MQHTEFLVDLLTDATIDAPAEHYVDLEKTILAREVETAIFQHPPSTITFPPILIAKHAVLRFACGIKQAVWLRIKNAVEFTITIETDGRRKQIFSQRLDPRSRETDRAWQRHELNLSEYAGARARISLQTRTGWRRSNEYAWAAWANPQIVHDVPKTAARLRTDDEPHIFLITADALTAKYLGGYGHPQVHTPHLDALAADGALCEQAWAQSCMTLGSYVSMLTGLYVHEHGVRREWESFPVGRTSLPQVLAAHGYHTLFSASSRELGERQNNLDRLFQEVIPTLSNPMQDGAITTRRFLKRFAERASGPWFNWLHYFDVHPPSMPPAPFDSMYYRNDPTDRRQEYLSSDISRIRAVESALVIRAALPLLERGEPVAEVIDILEDTAAVLTGASVQAPDLGEHVLKLGKPATQQQSPVVFGAWLLDRAREMRGGQVPRSLMSWIYEMLILLESTESDITSWLTGVRDFRYPLGIYLSTVSYFDAQAGALFAYLKEHDLYDQSLIIVTSPHGEILQDPALPYHHFLLTPDTLQVPLIIKPPANSRSKQGTRIKGVFDLIDLFPTVMEFLGLPNAAGISGTSRCHEIKNGLEIPKHDSFAAGLHQLSHSVYRPPYLFSRVVPDIGESFYTAVTGARELLLDLERGEVPQNMPDVADELRRALTNYGNDTRPGRG